MRNPSSVTTWMELPLGRERLSEVILFGHGKDADVMIELLDGRKYVLSVGGVLRVVGCPGLEVEVTRWDDRSLIIRYFGQDLALAAVRIEVPEQAGGVEGFFDDVRAWLAADGEHDLLWALSMQVEVVQISQGS